ncbi:hypothetical protein JCM10213_008309 [Rhodosporidiobolus nylandii]
MFSLQPLARLIERMHEAAKPLYTPPAPPPTLPTLPVELLEAIVSFAAPPTFASPSAYRERQKLLYALCLSSRQFYVVAQPRLPSVFEIASWQDVYYLEREQHRGLWDKVEVLAVTQAPWGVDEDANLREVLPFFPAVKDLRIWRCEGVDLRWLEALPNLEHLSVSASRLRLHGLLPRFPRLRQLSLDSTRLSSTQLAAILDPACTPRLAALALRCQIPPPPSYLSRLELLSLDAADRSTVAILPSIYTICPVVLSVNLETGSPSFPPPLTGDPPHLRLYLDGRPPDYSSPSDDDEPLSDEDILWATYPPLLGHVNRHLWALKRRRATYASISVPIAIEPLLDEIPFAEQLLSECEALDIPVRWAEDYVEEWTSLVPQGLWAEVQAKKARAVD